MVDRAEMAKMRRLAKFREDRWNCC